MITHVSFHVIGGGDTLRPYTHYAFAKAFEDESVILSGIALGPMKAHRPDSSVKDDLFWSGMQQSGQVDCKDCEH